MKRIVLFLFILLTLTAFVSAQNTGLTSVFFDSSVGVFENELDTALKVGPDFTSLDYSYLFAGLGNLEKVEADTNAWFGIPLWAGYYKAGDKPWSVFAGFVATDSTGNLAGGTTYTPGAPETVTDPVTGDTTDHQWNSGVLTTDYTANRLFDDLDFSGQYLFMLGNMNTGVYLGVDISDASPQATNYTETDVRYYNASGAGVIPTPTADYTFTRTETDKATDSTYSIGIPLFMGTDSLGHTINLTADINLVDNSVTDVQTYSGTPDTALGLVTNVEVDETIDKTTTTDIGVDYTMTKAGILGDHPDNELTINADGGIIIDSSKYSDVLTTQNVSYAGGGAAAVIGTRDDDSTTDTCKNAFDFDISIGAGHSFFFDLGSMVEFGFIPEISIGISMDNPVLREQRVVINRVDGDADGAFTSAADTITTITTTYTNTTAAAGNNISTMEIETTLALPVAATITPEGWPISITLGSKPQVQMKNTITTTKTQVSSTVTSTVDGTGADVGVVATTNAGTSNETTVTDTTFDVTAEHNIGLTMPLGEYVRLDVSLDFSTAINVLDFKDLIIQAIVSLP
jgi:hypothetical protein